ncbi:MAG: SLATT domain-containing protein [Pseudomonadota bacterium]
MIKSELILRMEADCKIRGNAHRNLFTSFRTWHIRLGLPSALLATAAGSLATITADAASLASQYSGFEIAGLICTWTVALFTAANTFIRPQEASQGHREKAGAYDVLLGQIGRACEYLKDDDLKKKIEAIDLKIEELKQSDPFLSDKKIRESKKILMQNGDLPQPGECNVRKSE